MQFDVEYDVRLVQIFAEDLSMKTISACLVAVLVLNAYGLADPAEPRSDTQATPASNAQPAEKIKAEIERRGAGEKSRVKVRLRDKTDVKGYISQIHTTSFRVTDDKTGKAATIAYDSVEKLSGRGLSRNTKIVIFVGIGIAAAGIILGILSVKLNHS
jgi:hypothetical protein